MRPPGAILAPGESIIATGNLIIMLTNLCLLSTLLFSFLISVLVNLTNLSFLFWVFPVFKFVEQPENNEKPTDQRNRVKFKIMSLKVKEPMDYVPELVSTFVLFMPFILYLCFAVWL